MPKFTSRSGQYPVVAGSTAGFIERGGRDSSVATKPIIDRVLILAAMVCAAGLVWQLTVLLTAKGHGTATHKVETATPAKIDTASADAPGTPAPTKTDQAAVRVVYPPEGDAGTAKTTLKAVDTPIGLVPQAAPAGAPSAAANASASVKATQPSAPAMSPQVGTSQSASFDPVAAAPSAAAQPVLPSAGPAAQVGFGLPSLNTPGQSTPAAQPDPAAPAPPAQIVAKAEAPTPGASQAKTSTSGEVVNINSASIEALNRLPGGGHIGNAIASHRPYRSVEDLVKKRVLRRDVYEQIKRQIATE